MSYNIPKLPDLYPCANCGRLLNVKAYKRDDPPSDKCPDEKIHYIYDSWIRPFILLCTCGHYTVVREPLSPRAAP